MRKWIVILLVGVVAAGLLVWAAFRPLAAITFVGYSEDGNSAEFVLKSYTKHYLGRSHPIIQVATPQGWTDYYDPVESLIGCSTWPVLDGGSLKLSATLPPNKCRWRARIRCTVIRVHERGSILDRVEALMKLVGINAMHRSFMVYTDEFVRP